MSERTEVPRRTFMAGAAATVLAAGTSDSVASAAPTEGRTDMSQPQGNRFDQPGNPSRKAHHVFAETEYEHYQRMRSTQQDGSNGSDSGGNPTGSGGGPGKPIAPNFGRTVDAVDEFGVDPNGDRPISDDIDSLPEDTLVKFPEGSFKLTGMSQFEATKCGFVGIGYDREKPTSSKEKTTRFVAPADTYAGFEFTMQTGFVGGFVMDMRAPKSAMVMRLGSSGFVHARNVVWTGVVDNVGSPALDQKMGDYLCALQPDEGATARVTRFTMKNNGVPGSKNKGAKNAFWVGESCRGTAQIEDCVVIGNASNGVYGGRTAGDTQIKGGLWVNNEVSQNRFSGRGSWSDGATMILDANRYEGPTGRNGPWNNKIGVNGVKIERGDNGINKPSGAVVRNADIQLLNGGPRGLGSGILVRGSGGAVKVENCRFTIQDDCMPVNAESPGTGYSGSTPPQPHNITITDSLFQGKNTSPVIKVGRRPNSLIRNTCFKIPGASTGSIEGIQVGTGVGFGKQCKAGSGLEAPKKVGSGGKLSAANFSVPNASYTGEASASNGSGTGWAGKLLGGLAVAPLVGIAVMALPLIVGLLVLGGVTFGGLLLFFKKLS